MNRYKYSGLKEVNGVFDQINNVSIPVGAKGWEEFQDYVEVGGQVDPWKTEKELLENALTEKLQELHDEKNNRTDVAIGTSDPRKKDTKMAKSISLLLKKVNGLITPEQETELNAISSLFDHLDDLSNEHDVAESWLEDSERTLLEIQNYDVVVDTGWTALP